jgi:uncharacterized protein (DUF58 family)
MDSTVSTSTSLSKWQGRLEGFITLERVIWLLVIVVFLVAWNRGLHLLYAMLAFLLSALLVSYAGAWWQLRRLTCVVTLPAEVFAGQKVSAGVTITSKGKRYLLAAQLLNEKNSLNGESLAIFNELYGSTTQPLSLRFSRRGEYEFDQLKITSYFPFGLVKLSKNFPIPMVACLVYPQVFALRQLPEQLLLGSQIDGDIPQHLQKAEQDFAMVRAYRDGDEMRHMHWRMSAKHNEWIVKEFDSTKMPAIAVILNADVNWVVEDQFNPREHMLQIVASLAEKCAQDGCGLLVVLSDEHHYQVTPYQRDLQPLLRELALWQGDGQTTTADIAAQLKAYPLVINFSDTKQINVKPLPLMTYQHQMNICFDYASYPSFGVNAGIKASQQGRQTQIKIGSSTQLWGVFG